MAEHYTCEACGLFFDADKNETSQEELIISAPGHTFSDEWKNNEEKHWRECSCGAKTEENIHNFEWKIDKEAEVGVAGSKHEECTECGYRKAAVEIPAIKAPEYPPVIDHTEGGKITVNPENPQAGEKVTITVQPESGKTVEKVMVIDEEGKAISVIDNGDGVYTFTQPDGKVTIRAIFATETDNSSTDGKSPQTGDESRMIFWWTLMLTAVSGLFGTAFYGRKKKKEL